MTNMKLYEHFRNVPAEAQKTIGGGRLKGMTDINPMWRIKKLTEEFGPCGEGWYVEIRDKVVEEVGEERAVFLEVALYYKTDDGWSKPVIGMGGSMLAAQEKGGIHANDEAFKMAYTDAISIACKMLGMAADIYFAKDRTKYDVSDYTPPVADKKALIKQITDVVAADLNLKSLVDQHKAAYGAEKITDLSVEHLESLYRLLTEA